MQPFIFKWELMANGISHVEVSHDMKNACVFLSFPSLIREFVPSLLSKTLAFFSGGANRPP